MLRLFHMHGLGTAVLGMVSLWGGAARLAAQEPPAPFPQRLAAPGVPNLVGVHPRVFSGGLPDGEVGFRELAALGVKTLVSVDAARPDVEGAGKFGLRYVHLPHGYDGIPAARAQQLAKAVAELAGPIYIHCHHGKHRSPAAASVACVGAGLIEPATATAILQLAGTSDHYRGLYRAAAGAHVFAPGELAALEFEFQETAEVPPLAEAMSLVEQTHDHLNRIAAAGWQPPSNHPDLVAAHEALLLREHFTEMLRAPETAAWPAPFREMLRDSEHAATELERLVRQQQGGATDGETRPRGEEAVASLHEAAAKHLARISETCKQCHLQYRDQPRNE